MPNHWESSARPLFVKTIFVDGNRHAILSQKDPLLNISKRRSRPKSSFSVGSTLSISSSESEDTCSENKLKSFKHEEIQSPNSKDIYLQLQDCLVKQRLTSKGGTGKRMEKEENSMEDGQEKKEDKTPSQKRKKSNYGRNKSSKRKSCTYFYQESFADNQLPEATNTGNCCYVYNFENSKGKKKYCFVKITSKPSDLILNCACDEDGEECHEFCGSKDSSNKNNLVISATFHNLVMNSENTPNDSPDCLASTKEKNSCDFYWNNYLTRSYYHSLSEKVIQWLDLTKKKKNKETCDMQFQDVSTDSIERIFAGNTYLDASTRSEKSVGKVLVKKDKCRFGPQEDVDSEVKVEDNVETALSIDCGHESPEESTSDRKTSTPRIFDSQNHIMSTIPFKFDSNTDISSYLKSSIIERLYKKPSTSPNSLSANIEDFTQVQNKRKTLMEKQKVAKSEEEDENFQIKAIKRWERKVSQKTKLDKFSGVECRCSQSSEWESARKTKHQNIALGLEQNYKSINNPNITRTRPGSQTLLSPQQQNKMSWVVSGKTEKEPGKPQLHIFIPSMPDRDPNEDNLSECERVLGQPS